MVNSLSVPAKFEKQHQHILRDIRELLARPDLDALNWFHPADYIDEQGKSRPAYDLTRDGWRLSCVRS